MTRTEHHICLVFACVLVSGCSGLTQMQDSLNKFGTGATSASTAEMTFLNNVQTLDCSVQFYANTSDWAIGQGSNYDITGACTPKVITNAQITIRQRMLDGITAYAGKIQALASSSGDKTLDANGQSLAQNLNNLAQSAGITKSDATIAADVEGALIQLANMALDQTRYNDAKKAASDMQRYLQAVVTELKTENINYATAIASNRGKLELSLRKVIDTIPANKDSNGVVVSAQLRLESVLRARQIVRSANPFGQEVIAPSTGIPTPDPTTLNNALDGIVNANQAIANSGDGGIAAAVTDLVTRAQAAQADEAAITK